MESDSDCETALDLPEGKTEIQGYLFEPVTGPLPVPPDSESSDESSESETEDRAVEEW